jgi:GxxExxY protein
MDANNREFSGILGKEVYEIIGCAFEVHNTLGHGLKEKLYENALCVDFGFGDILFEQQKIFKVHYKGEHIGEFVPDLIVHDTIIIDAKTIERITDIERGQVLNYLRISGLQIGLLINFKVTRLEWEHIILTTT